MGTKTEQRVLVAVDADHMKAWLRLAPEVDLADLTAGEITVALEAAKVAVGDPVVARIHEFLEQVAEKQADEGKAPREAFLTAEGRPPVEGQHGEFIRAKPPDQQDQDNDEDARIDYRTVNMIRTVEKDEVIGTVKPPVPGRPGIDVHANEVQPRKRIEAIKLQANVRLAEDRRAVIAEEAGRVVLDGNKLFIRPVLDINGDVDFESGNVDATSDVNVRGTVRDLFEVLSKKSITISGAVEAAKVEADEDMVVRGGIMARSKGVVRAGGRIVTKMCNEAYLHAEGGIEVTKEVLNSRLYTMGKLLSKRAVVIGGEVYAREGVEVHTIGSDACVPTRVWVGIHPRVFKRVRQLEAECKKQQESVEKIRNMVKPLLDNVKRLASSQKEQATELMYQADMIEQTIQAKRAEQEELLAANRPASPPYITVQGRVCQNSTIAIDGREVHFHDDVKGPIKIEKRKVENVTEVVAVNSLTGSVTTLGSTDLDPDTVPDQDEDPFEQAKASEQTDEKA